MHVLPDDLRDLLKTPIGQLVDEKKLVEILKDEEYIVSIGDLVTYTLLKHNIEPSFCVVDYHTRRGKCSDEICNLIRSFGKKSVIVKNPKGCITDELWNVINFALENLDTGGIRIEVKGEEDLASLAVIYMAPKNVSVIYGLFDKGILVVKPTDENKKKSENVLNKMKGK
jgi:uncharacterized protein (UPF0218 family)